MSDWTISCEGIYKKFGYRLKDSMWLGLRDAAKGIAGVRDNEKTLRSGEFWALQDISFQVKQGECLGVMGVNGSGKSTLFRTLSSVFLPDHGIIKVRGKLGALIAIGAGFSPLLSGRENIYLNATLLGLSKQEINKKFDAIVDFSGIEEFIDLPVKHYSSGMMVKLGFSIAAFGDPDVLLIDEVLAVGDLAFQKKCYDHVLTLKRNGTSLLLVSHSPAIIWSLCDTGILLHHGKLVYQGAVENLTRAYDELNAKDAVAQWSKGIDEQASSSSSIAIHSVKVSKEEIGFGEEFYLDADMEIREAIEEPRLRFTIDAAQYRFILSLDSYEQNWKPKRLEPGRYLIKVKVNHPNLLPGAYRVNVSVGCRFQPEQLFFWNGAASFMVQHPRDKYLFSHPFAVLHVDSDFDVAKAS